MLSGAWTWIESSPSNSRESIKHLPLERASTICSHHPAATAAAASSSSASSSPSPSLAPSGVEEAQFLVHITCVCLKRAEWCLWDSNNLKKMGKYVYIQWACGQQMMGSIIHIRRLYHVISYLFMYLFYLLTLSILSVLSNLSVCLSAWLFIYLFKNISYLAIVVKLICTKQRTGAVSCRLNLTWRPLGSQLIHCSARIFPHMSVSFLPVRMYSCIALCMFVFFLHAPLYICILKERNLWYIHVLYIHMRVGYMNIDKLW